jgi:carboxypeptidase PM20D1
VGEQIRFEVIEARKGSISSTTDPLFEALMYYATAGEDNSVAGPVISVGFTDSNYLRPLGVQAYGFVPISLTAEEMAGFHGHNEKISIEDLEDGTRKLFSSVFAVSAP